MNVSRKHLHRGNYWVIAALTFLLLTSLPGWIQAELNAPSVRTLKIFDIAQVTTTKTLQFRHAVLGSK